MLTFKSTAKSVLSLGLLMSLMACAVMQGRETAGQYVDDATITASIKASLVKDPVVSAMQINVETMQGVVQLSGFVDSEAKEERAVRIANLTKGVQSVNDNIVVRSSKAGK